MVFEKLVLELWAWLFLFFEDQIKEKPLINFGISISSENDSKKQEKKCMNTVVEDSDMAVQAALDNISKRLDTLATKVDVEQIKDEVKCLTKTFMEKLEKLEGRLFATEVKADKLESEVKSLKKVNKTATGIIKQ